MTSEITKDNKSEPGGCAGVPVLAPSPPDAMPKPTKMNRAEMLAVVAAGGVHSNAETMASFGRATLGDLSPTECAMAILNTAKDLNGGDQSSSVRLLAAQAVALNVMFGELARVGQANMFKAPDQADRYLRLAFKAQSQSRATLETLAAIKNPPVVFARQANFSGGGPQQVVNGQAPTGARYAQACASAHPGEFISRPNELLEDRSHGSPQLDTRATAAAGRTNPGLEPVGAFNGPTQR